MSPRRFLGVLAATGDEGKSRGSDSGGASEGISTCLLGVFTGDELGNAIGDELPTPNKGVFMGVLKPTARLAVIPRSGLL